jgi:hypothetical protein
MTDAERAWEPPLWEPPLAGTESAQLIGAIERHRATFQRHADLLREAVDGRVGEDPPAGRQPRGPV